MLSCFCLKGRHVQGAFSRVRKLLFQKPLHTCPRFPLLRVGPHPIPELVAVPSLVLSDTALPAFPHAGREVDAQMKFRDLPGTPLPASLFPSLPSLLYCSLFVHSFIYTVVPQRCIELPWWARHSLTQTESLHGACVPTGVMPDEQTNRVRV